MWKYHHNCKTWLDKTNCTVMMCTTIIIMYNNNCTYMQLKKTIIWLSINYFSHGLHSIRHWLYNFVAVFGVDLTTLVKLHNCKRPYVVEACIAEVEKRGID